MLTPVFTQGEAFRDDPDFPLALGEKGLSRKLAIFSREASLRQLSVTLQEQEDMVSRLEGVRMSSTPLKAFHLLSSPERPERHDGPGAALLGLLGALSGGVIAAGLVLFRAACQLTTAPQPVRDGGGGQGRAESVPYPVVAPSVVPPPDPAGSQVPPCAHTGQPCAYGHLRGGAG